VNTEKPLTQTVKKRGKTAPDQNFVIPISREKRFATVQQREV